MDVFFWDTLVELDCVSYHAVHTYTHTHPFYGPLSRTTRVSQYQKGKTNLDFTEARDSEWQWHQLGDMQVCTLLQTDTTPASHHSVFLQAGCPSCHPTNSIKALKAYIHACTYIHAHIYIALKIVKTNLRHCYQ